MSLNKKITAFFTASAIALTLTACSEAPSGGSEPTRGAAENLADKPIDDPVEKPLDNPVDKLAKKYENDFISDLKKSGDTSLSRTEATIGWDPEAVTSDRLENGGDAILSRASLDGMNVSLIAHDITHLPDDEIDGELHTANCEGNLCADKILLYLEDDIGRKMLSTQINGSVGHHAIGGECLFDGSTRIYKTEQDGETYYLLMQYAMYDKDGKALIASFYVLDMELYERSAESIGENGILCGSLWFVNIADPGEKRVGGWAQGYQASKEFAFKEGTTFYDPEYGYEITFDMKKGRAKVVYPG